MQIDRERLAWAAGFFEGEGYVACHLHRDTRAVSAAAKAQISPCVSLEITQVNEEPIYLLATILPGGNLVGPYKNPRSNNYSIRYRTTKFEIAQAWIAMMWPWLSTKRRQQAKGCVAVVPHDINQSTTTEKGSSKGCTMQVVHIDIPEDAGYLVPLGDLHRGDRHLTARGLNKLKGYLDWVQEHANARIFLMGDILNTASRSSKTNPFESMSGNDEYQKAIELFAPYKAQIVGCVTGNHEQRMYKEFGFNPLLPFCKELDIPYCGFSACLHIRVGQRKESTNQYEQVYWGYVHHGVGGGGTLGAAINRKAKLQEIVHGMDFYMAGHDHQLIAGSRNVLLPKRDKIVHQRTHYIDTGSFLDWNESYAEEAAMPIGKLGAPRLRFDGRENHHDLHVSI